MNRRNRFLLSPALKWALFLLPFVLVLGIVALKLESQLLYWEIAAKEDGPIEYLTALVYLAATPIAFLIGLRFYRQRQRLYALLYGLLAAGLLFICFEEISWGQRLLDFDSPELFAEHNVQGEVNLHNFADRYRLHLAYILVSAYGAFAFLFVPHLLAPRTILADLITPNWFLMTYFLPTMLLYIYYDYMSPVLVALFGEPMGWGWQPDGEHFIIGKDQEPIEFIMALGFLLFVGINRRRQMAGAFDESTSTPAPQ